MLEMGAQIAGIFVALVLDLAHHLIELAETLSQRLHSSLDRRGLIEHFGRAPGKEHDNGPDRNAEAEKSEFDGDVHVCCNPNTSPKNLVVRFHASSAAEATYELRVSSKNACPADG